VPGVLERDLSCVDALFHYGRLLQEVRGNHVGAERMYRRVLADGAEDLYKRALAVDPHSRHALLHYGKLLQFARRDMSGAEGLYRRLLGINSQKVNVLVHLCCKVTIY